MLQREKDKSNREKNLEQLFTQLDRSASGAALNISTAPDVDDVKDSKIAALESSVSTLKSEKRKLEMKLVSLETIQGGETIFSDFNKLLKLILIIYRSQRMP